MVASCEEWDFRRLGMKCMVYFYFYGACYWCFCPFQVSTDIVTKTAIATKRTKCLILCSTRSYIGTT